jgi:hypothetical protein
MLLGKLQNKATKVFQVSAFETKTETADYMVVKADFTIGASKVKFDVRFGNIIEENGSERFDILLRDSISLTSDELASWGTDDSVVLDLIASKLNNIIIEKIEKLKFQHTY